MLVPNPLVTALQVTPSFILLLIVPPSPTAIQTPFPYATENIVPLAANPLVTVLQVTPSFVLFRILLVLLWFQPAAIQTPFPYATDCIWVWGVELKPASITFQFTPPFVLLNIYGAQYPAIV